MTGTHAEGFSGLPLAAPWPIDWRGEVTSTSDIAQQLAREGVPGPIWIGAEAQTAGRGRRGRSWLTVSGNLFATALISVDCSPSEATRICFVAALAISDTIETLSNGQVQPKLKWPNDVRVDGRKVSGILVETGRLPNDRLWIAIGCGVNLAGAPSDIEQEAVGLTSLTGEAYDSREALRSLDDKLRHRLEQLRTAGFSLVLADWLNKAEGLGKTMRATLASEPIQGIFVGLSTDGELQLRLPSGEVHTVTAGDVELVREIGTDAADD